MSESSNTPKPTPRDSIYRLLAATADGPAVETLQADCSEIIVALDELDALRAENAALKAKLEEAEATNDRLRQDRLDYSAATTTEGMNASEWIWRTGKAERERDTAESRATALAARVEALETCLLSHSELPTGGPCSYWGKGEQSVLSSTPSDDLAAHDDRIRRETVERIDIYFHEHPIAWQDSSIPERTRYFHRAAGLPEPGHAGEED